MVRSEEGKPLCPETLVAARQGRRKAGDSIPQNRIQLGTQPGTCWLLRVLVFVQRLRSEAESSSVHPGKV